MRQEKTLKLVVNTLIDPRIKMTNMETNDKTWVWTCYDFSEGTIVEEVFAFKCSSVEDAAAFKEVDTISQYFLLSATLPGGVVFRRRAVVVTDSASPPRNSLRW